MRTIDDLKLLLSEFLTFSTNGTPEISTSMKFKDIGMDSLDVLEFMMALEDEYKIIITDDEADDFKTFGDVLAHLNKVKE